MKKLNKGFTLIEILVVIGIIAILAAIVIVAINPARQFAQARNTQRESDVSTILNAIGQNMVDKKGNALSLSTCPTLDSSSAAIPNAPASAVEIGSGGTSQVDLGCLVPTYIASAMPFDPDGGTDANTLYTIVATSTGRYVICAPKHNEPGVLDAGSYCLTR